MPGKRATNDKMRPAKQEDVAKAAGVSTATVSHVLSGRSDRVSEPTRRRVLDAIRQLGYKAPPMDLRAREPHTHNIGVLMPDITESPITRDFFFRHLLDSVLSTCLLRGWGVTVMAERMWTDAGQTIRRTYDGRCDGVLVIAPQDDESITPLVERGVPVVQVGSRARLPQVSSVDIDNEAIGRQAAEVFLAKGHRRCGFGGKTSMAASRERLASFQSTIEAAGGTVLTYEFEAFGPREEVRKRTPDWLAAGCTAIFAWNDDVACLLYKALAEVGQRVPKDVSVIGVNDTRGTILRPQLTTFSLPLAEMGSRAAEMLLGQIINGLPPGDQVLFDATLICRKSVAVPKTSE